VSAVARISLEHGGAAVTARVSGEVDVTNASFVREELTLARRRQELSPCGASELSAAARAHRV